MENHGCAGVARKLFFAFTGIAVIPLLMAFVVSVSVLLSQAELFASEVLWGKLRLAELQYEATRDSMVRTLEAASGDTRILVNMELSLDTAVADNLTEIGSNQSLDGLWIYTPERKLFASTRGTARQDSIPGEFELSFPAGDDPVISILERADGSAAFMGTKRLVSGNGGTVGYIRAGIDAARFCAEASESAKAPVFIVLESGKQLMAPEFGEDRIAPMVFTRGIMPKAETGNPDRGTATFDGADYLVSLMPVTEKDGFSMRLGVAYPESLIKGPRNRELSLLGAAGVIAVVLALLGGSYFKRKIIVPVLAVSDAARVISEGVYGKIVDVDLPESGALDEIGTLARDFNRMSERLYAQGKERESAERVIEESIREKETLLREIHHRVKNNFQIINSLFDLQLMNTDSEAVQSSLNEPKARIHAMALIHDRLYQSGTFSSIDFGDYVSELTRDLFYSYNIDPSRIMLGIDADSVPLDMDRAIPCGLILNELVTNALKYAFPDPSGKGVITVSLKKTDSLITLRVKDDGKGLSADVAARSRGTLGLTLVRSLCEQIKGTFELESGPGVTATIRF